MQINVDILLYLKSIEGYIVILHIECGDIYHNGILIAPCYHSICLHRKISCSQVLGKTLNN